jgi:hypothetical protein
MGRTVVSIVQAFHQEQESWRKFRRALTRDDREAFDRLFQHARRHAAEASYVARPTPFEAVVMAVLLEQEKALGEIRSRLDKLEAGRLDKLVPSGVEGLEAGPFENLRAGRERKPDEDPGLAL